MDRRKDFLIRNNIPCIVDSEQLDKKGPFGRPVTAFRLAVPLDYVMEAESLLEE
jgi:predicted transcriptional regulator